MNIDTIDFDCECIDLNSPSDLNQYVSDHSNLSLININIRSLKKNYGKLTTLLSQLKFKPKFIVVTETW